MPDHTASETIRGILDHARQLHEQGRTFEAMEYLENRPEFKTSHRILALLAHYQYLERQYDIASVTARRALSIHPEDAFALFTLGEIAIKSRKLDQAEMYFRDALTAGSRSVYPYVRLAAVALEQLQYDRAIDVLHEGLAVHTGHPELLEPLHLALTMAGRHREAEHIRMTRRGLNHDDAGDLRKLLHRFESLDRDKAIEQLHILLSMAHYRKEPMIHNQLARYLAAAGRYADAVPHLEQLVEMQPRNDSARLRLAEAWVHSGAPEKASRILESMEGYRNDIRLLTVKIAVLDALGQHQAAMDLCVELLRREPRNKRLRQILQDLKRSGIRPKR